MSTLPTDTKALRKALFTLRTTYNPNAPTPQANADVITALINTVDRLLPAPKRITTTRWLVTFSNKAPSDDPDGRCVHSRGMFEDREDASDCARQLNESGDAVCVQVHKVDVEVPVYGCE